MKSYKTFEGVTLGEVDGMEENRAEMGVPK